MNESGYQHLAESVLKTRYWKYSSAMAELTATFEKLLEFEVDQACRAARQENVNLRDAVRDLVKEAMKQPEPFQIVKAA